MNIAVIGTGYVGLVSGACLSEFGHRVRCMDIDENKISILKSGGIPIFEAGLEAIVKKNSAAGRLTFSTDYDETVTQSDVIFIAVGTPPNEDGSADVRHVMSASEMIALSMNGYKTIVNKSTVPIGTGKRTKETIKNALEKRGASFEFDVVSNPEFLREGVAVNDFMHPDRIVIGTESDRALDTMKEIYRVLYLNNHPFVCTDIETAELIKYASNAFLATKISFINEISGLCEVIGANVQQVSSAMGHDKRIGKYFLHAGPGYGGSCFPKDTQALVSTGREYGVEMSIVESAIKANEKQKLHMADKIVTKLGGDIRGKRIAVLGLSFKPETDDVREAPAYTIVSSLLGGDAKVCAYDPIAMDNFRMLGDEVAGLEYARDEYSAAADADALVIVTEWSQFRGLDFKKLSKQMRGRHFFDLRNIYNKADVEKRGFVYEGVGK